MAQGKFQFQKHTGKNPVKPLAPEGMLHETGEDRANEMIERHTSSPLSLRTEHLLGSIEKYGDREFGLKADLIDRDWDKSLFLHAQNIAQEHDVNSPRPFGSSPGSSWENSDGTMMTKVNVSEFGQIEARGIWTQIKLPTEDEILGKFKGLLDAIERGSEEEAVPQVAASRMPDVPNLSGLADAMRVGGRAIAGERAGK